MPPTAAIALAVTLELPPALAAFDAGEFEKRMQVGALIVVFPLLVMPGVLALGSSASTQAVPVSILAAVAFAMIVGAVVMKSELKGRRCCTASVTHTLFVIPAALVTGQLAS